MSPFRLPSPGLLAAFVCGVGLLTTALLVGHLERSGAAADRARFAAECKRLEGAATRHFRLLESAVRGPGALWAAKAGVVTRAEFEAFVKDHDLVKELPGALGLGFVRRVPRAGLDEFLDATRADEAPEFKVKTQGDADELFVVEFIEPAEANRAALGLDLAQDAGRHAAAEAALLSGATVGTPPLTLVQAPEAGPGMLLLHPVYGPGPPPPGAEERRTRLVGWTGLPLIVDRLFSAIARELGGEVDFSVQTTGDQAVRRPLYETARRGTTTHESAGDLEQLILLSFAQKTWTFHVRPGPRFTPTSHVESRTAVLLGGVALSLLLGWLVLRLRRVAVQADERSAAATTDLSALVEDVRLLALVATRTTNAVVFTDANRLITWVNQGFTRMTGYSAAEALGKHPGVLLQCENSDPAVIAVMRAALGRGEACRCELINRRKSGADYWTDLDIVPLHDGDGIVTGFMAVQNDITPHKAAGEKLRDAAERTALALEAGELGLWDWDVQTGLTHFDARWGAMLGEDATTLPPNAEEWSKRCHPDDLPRAQADLENHFAGETPLYQCLHRLRHRDGSWRWIMACGRLVARTRDGKPQRMVGTHQDVTAQQLAKIELERSSAAFGHIGRLARVGYWEVNVVAGTIFWSDQVRAIHEVPPDYVPNLATATDFYPGEARAEISRLVQVTIDTGAPFDVELPFVTAQGNSIWVRALGEAVRPSGVTIAIRGAFQDITESRRQRDALAAARDAAETAGRAKADFLANMSHEIRTPINAVIGMTELLQTTPLNPEQTEFTDTIRTSSQSLLSLINEILDFSKIEAGGLELEHEPLGLRECAEHAIELVARQAAAKNLELFVSLDPTLPAAILGDAARLRQILVNLLGNAVKFTAEGEIELILAAAPPEPESPAALRITVRDTGIGIPTDRRDRLFKSFSQVDSSTTRVYGGTGLGLAISSRLVGLMQGRIWVESTPGRGSLFHLEIPIHPATATPPPPALPAELHGLNLLVVAPHPGIRRQLLNQIEGWGLHAVPAGDFTAAVARLAAGEPFDGVLVDAPASGPNGDALAAALRRVAAARPLPLVLLTRRGETLGNHAELAAARIVAKPPKAALLLDALVQALRPATPVTTPAPRAPTPPPPAAFSAPSALRLVLAEDLPVNQRVALLILESLGHTASIANHGLEALALISRQPVDILFLDVQMPEMDGLTCAARLCEEYPPETRPWIIAMTANALEGDRERCLAAGMDDYISKPISGPAISAAIDRAVEGLAARRPG